MKKNKRRLNSKESVISELVKEKITIEKWLTQTDAGASHDRRDGGNSRQEKQGSRDFVEAQLVKYPVTAQFWIQKVHATLKCEPNL